MTLLRRLFLPLALLLCLSTVGCTAAARGAVEDARSASCRAVRVGCRALVSACDATEPDAGVSAPAE